MVYGAFVLWGFWHGGWLVVERYTGMAKATGTAALPEEWVRRLALAGTPEQVRRRIDELGTAGVTSSVFIPAGSDPIAALIALASVL